MAKSAPKLEWCIVRLGDDMNWWVEETSDPINWDTVDGLSILDPRQVAYVIENCDQLVYYGLQPSLVDKAFFRFAIEKQLDKNRVRLVKVDDSLFEPGESLFALPDFIDEEKGPYADLVNQLTRYRVAMLNDLIDFEQNLTIDEIEEELREAQQQDYLEGKALHAFEELSDILEYVPEGYELEEEDMPSRSSSSHEYDNAFPDLDDDEEEESLEEDETMRWGDDDEDEDADDDYDSDDSEDEDEDEDDDYRPRKRGPAPKPKKPRGKK